MEMVLEKIIDYFSVTYLYIMKIFAILNILSHYHKPGDL